MKNFCSIAAYGRFFFFGMAYLGDLNSIYFTCLLTLKKSGYICIEIPFFIGRAYLDMESDGGGVSKL